MANKSNKLIIYIEDWQIQCCGKPFKIGDTVEWIVHEDGKPSECSDNVIAYYYEHQSSDWEKLFIITGVVDASKALFYYLELRQYPDKKRGAYYQPIYKMAREVLVADGWDEDIKNLEFGGYEVSLRNFVIRSAQELEITFS